MVPVLATVPEPRSLLLLRHGQTAYNAQKRIQGHRDVPLDPTGERQAADVAAVVAAMAPAVVRSSDLARARVTAEAVAAAAGVRVTTDPRLREFDLGERTGWTHDEYLAADPAEFARFRSGDYAAAPGAESLDTLLARTVPALDDTLEQVPAGGLGVVVAHGAALRVSAAAWVGLPGAAGLSFAPLGNCHWALVEETTEEDARSRTRRMVAWNRHA